MFSPSLFAVRIMHPKAIGFSMFMLLIEWVNRDKQFGFQWRGTGLLQYRSVRWMMYLAVIMFIIMFSGEKSDFIYFQF
jgi:hypothetical protein